MGVLISVGAPIKKGDNLQHVAERLPGWWVAKTRTRGISKFTSQLKVEHYTPLSPVRQVPFIPYVFVRAGERLDASQPGFKGWITANGARAIVTDTELEEFKQGIERLHGTTDKAKREATKQKCRIILKINASTEIRAEL